MADTIYQQSEIDNIMDPNKKIPYMNQEVTGLSGSFFSSDVNIDVKNAKLKRILGKEGTIWK